MVVGVCEKQKKLMERKPEGCFDFLLSELNGNSTPVFERVVMTSGIVVTPMLADVYGGGFCRGSRGVYVYFW